MTDDQLRRMDSEAGAWRDRYGALIEAALRALAADRDDRVGAHHAP